MNDDWLVSLDVMLSNRLGIITIHEPGNPVVTSLPVVPHKAVAEVSK